MINKSSKWRLIIHPLDENDNLLTAGINEMEMFVKAVTVEILEVSEHYDE